MKLRIKGNTLRLRLTKTDLNHLCFLGKNEEVTTIGNQKLVYNIHKSANSNNLSVNFENNMLNFSIPESFCDEWINTDKVGFEETVHNDDGTSLFILLEKDFMCKDESNEDQSDQFENPNALC